MRLVQFAQSHFGVLVKLGRKLVAFGHIAGPVLSDEARKSVLFIQWGRMPKTWELSFVAKMKSAEEQGIPFTEVLQTDLPVVLGQVPSDVLLRWVGRKARSQPKRFVKSINEMFGKSGKKIIVGLQDVLDPERMLEVQTPQEDKFQSLIDAIQQADAAKSVPARFLDEDRWKDFKA